MSHTPGPWAENDFSGLKGSNGKRVMAWGLGIAHGPRSVESEANTKLITAAPELLEALKYARRFLKKEDVDVCFIDAAIARAESI